MKDMTDKASEVCQCEKPDIWTKVYEGFICLNCMKPPRTDLELTGSAGQNNEV